MSWKDKKKIHLGSETGSLHWGDAIWLHEDELNSDREQIKQLGYNILHSLSSISNKLTYFFSDLGQLLKMILTHFFFFFFFITICSLEKIRRK